MTIVMKIINNKIAAAKIVPKSFDEISDLNFFFAKNIGLVFEEDFNGTWRRKVCHSWLVKIYWTGKNISEKCLGGGGGEGGAGGRSCRISGGHDSLCGIVTATVTLISPPNTRLCWPPLPPHF